MDTFNLSHQVVLGHMLRRRNFKEPEFHQSYRVASDKSDKSEMIVHCSVTCPVQFSISNLPSSTTVTDIRGKEWNDTNEGILCNEFLVGRDTSDVIELNALICC